MNFDIIVPFYKELCLISVREKLTNTERDLEATKIAEDVKSATNDAEVASKAAGEFY